jgi:hypothetical protein
MSSSKRFRSEEESSTAGTTKTAAPPSSSSVGSTTNDNKNQVYVLIGTHHLDDKPCSSGVIECLATTTVLGVFTTRALAEQALDREIDRVGWEMVNPRDDEYRTANRNTGCIWHFDGSFCTTFQIEEKKVLNKGVVEQNVVFSKREG